MAQVDSVDEGLAVLRATTKAELKKISSELNGDEKVKYVAEVIKHNKTWKMFDLSCNRIGNQGAKHIAEALKHNKTLTKLILSDNDIGVEGAKHVAEELKHNITLTKLSLSDNEIGDEGVQHISAALEDNKILTTLNLSTNQIGNEGAKHVAEALKRNKTLTYLILQNFPRQHNKIGDEGVKHIAEALKHNTTLKMLDLSWNEIGAEGVKHVSAALEHNKTLVYLNLEENKIGAEGAKHISEAFEHNKTLLFLDLQGNKIGAEGVKHIADLLSKTFMIELNLGENEIGAEGAKQIAEVLKHNKTLTTLNLRDSQIGEEGAKYVAEVLKHNTTLKTLNLQWNEIGIDGAKYVADALKHNTALTSLDLESNEISGTGAMHIADALNQNTTLIELNLCANYIGREGAMYIADAIKCNTALAKIDLTENTIGKEGVEYFKEAAKESLALRQRLQKWPKPPVNRKRKHSSSEDPTAHLAKSIAIECSVCLDPKEQLLLLPCLHHVCAQCLQDVKMSFCVCRVCQESFSADLVLPHHSTTPNNTIYCSQHPDNNATKFCFDCNVLLCTACDHDASHQLYDLEEAMNKIQIDLPPILDDLSTQLEQVNEAIEYIMFARSSALSKLASIKSAIELSFEALNNEELASQRDALLEQAQTIVNNQVKILDVQNEDLIAAKDARETALQQAQGLMTVGDLTQLRLYSVVLGRIQLLLNNPRQLEPLVFDLLRFEQLDPDDHPIGDVFEYEPPLDVKIDFENEIQVEEEEDFIFD